MCFWRSDAFQVMPSGPKFVVGDFNADMGNIPSISSALDAGRFIDIANHPTCSESLAQHTCCPDNGSSSRRDYAIVSAEALPYISNCTVSEHPDVPMHRGLQFNFTLPGSMPQVKRLKPVQSIVPMLDLTPRDAYGIEDDGNIPNHIADQSLGLHTHIESGFKEHEATQNQQKAANNTTGLWHTWTSIRSYTTAHTLQHIQTLHTKVPNRIRFMTGSTVMASSNWYKGLPIG